MVEKKVESLFSVEGSTKVIRILSKPLIPDKWLKGISHSEVKKYLVVKYTKSYDKYLPEPRQGKGWVPNWDDSTYTELNTLAPVPADPADRKETKPEKIQASNNKFNEADFEYYTVDHWFGTVNGGVGARNKFLEWCDDEGVGTIPQWI